MGTGPVPAAFVPIRLPWIVFCVDPAKRPMPLTPLPETRFPAPVAVPPITLSCVPPDSAMPWNALGSAAVPAAFVPM